MAAVGAPAGPADEGAASSDDDVADIVQELQPLLDGRDAEGSFSGDARRKRRREVPTFPIIELVEHETAACSEPSNHTPATCPCPITCTAHGGTPCRTWLIRAPVLGWSDDGWRLSRVTTVRARATLPAHEVYVRSVPLLAPGPYINAVDAYESVRYVAGQRSPADKAWDAACPRSSFHTHLHDFDLDDEDLQQILQAAAASVRRSNQSINAGYVDVVSHRSAHNDRVCVASLRSLLRHRSRRAVADYRQKGGAIMRSRWRLLADRMGAGTVAAMRRILELDPKHPSKGTGKRAAGAAAAAVDASSATDAAAVRPSPTPSEADELLEDTSDIELGTEPSPVSVVGAASGQGSSATVVGRQVAVAAPVAIQLIDDSGKSASELLPPSPVGAVDSPTVVTPVVATSAAQVVGAPAVAGGAPVAGAVAVVDDAPVAGAVTVVGGAPAAGAIETGVVGATGAVAAGEVAAVAGGAVATPAAAVDGAAVAVAGGAPAAPGGTPAAAVAAAREARLSAVQRAVAEGVPGQFTPMPEPLQFRLGRALREGKLSGDIEEGEQVEWCVLARSPTPVFSMLCTFSSTLDLGRSQTLPCGTHRSNNYITGAYPARDPKDQELMEMEW